MKPLGIIKNNPRQISYDEFMELVYGQKRSLMERHDYTSEEYTYRLAAIQLVYKRDPTQLTFYISKDEGLIINEKQEGTCDKAYDEIILTGRRASC